MEYVLIKISKSPMMLGMLANVLMKIASEVCAFNNESGAIFKIKSDKNIAELNDILSNYRLNDYILCAIQDPEHFRCRLNPTIDAALQLNETNPINLTEIGRDELEARLNELLESEQYEKAAEIRDMLNKGDN